jgi:maleylacetate reductase
LTVPGFDLEAWDQAVLFGVDRVHELGGQLERLGRKRPLVLCSWRRRRSEEYLHVAGGLGITPAVFQGAEGHCPRSVIEAAWRAVREHEADAVVSFGGGSTIDLGKAVAYAAEHGPEALDEDLATPPAEGAREARPPALAHVAVPTTYSGAEATRCFFVGERQEKRRWADARMRPDVVVADPSLTLALPWKPTAGSGMTALGHCLEALCSPLRTAWSDALAARAARSLFRLLPVVSGSPKRVTERSDMQAAAYVAGVVSELAGSGVHQALCTGLGGRAGVGHGLACAILLPHAIRFDPEPVAGGLGLFAEALGVGDPEKAANALGDLAAGLGLPQRLREVGVFEEDLEPVAAWVAERSPDARQDLRPVSVGHALSILRAAW